MASFTAAEAIAANWEILVGCDPCRICTNLPLHWIEASGRAGRDLEAAFLAGKMICHRCGSPSKWLKVNSIEPASQMRTEVMTLRRP